MENNKYVLDQAETVSVPRTFISGVFSWMTAALAISGIMAYLFGTNLEYMSYLLKIGPDGAVTGMNILGWVVMFAPLGFVLIMSAGVNRFSSTVLLGLFLAYSFVMGLSLSFIFLTYTSGSIFQTFIVSAATFGTMALLGYTTKTDLTKFGSILLMALVGIIIASLVNLFVGSGTLELVISIAGVLIFTGLTAYDVQKLKRIGAGVEYGTEAASKLTIMGALTLYLDFINLFLFLLRFLGNRRD